MVDDYVMISAGHAVGDLRGPTELRFFQANGCVEKQGVLLDRTLSARNSRDDEADDDWMVAVVTKSPNFGAPGAAFGRLYLRLWRTCPGQSVVAIGHRGGRALGAIYASVIRPKSDCTTNVDAQHCFSFGCIFGHNLDGNSGGPILDLDGAVRGLFRGRISSGLVCGDPRWAEAEVIATRLDVVAAAVPEIRSIVRRQAPQVLESLGALAGLAIPEGEIEALHHWGRMVAMSLQWMRIPLHRGRTGVGAPRSGGWSVFYRDRAHDHVFHLVTDDDGGRRVPNIVHEDVSVLGGVCRIGKPGLIHAWPGRIQLDDGQAAERNLVLAEEIDGGTRLVHLRRSLEGRWSKHNIGAVRNDVRWPSAGCISNGGGRNPRNPRPHPWIVICEGRHLTVLDKPGDAQWQEIRFQVIDNVRVPPDRQRIEAVAIWYGEDSPSFEPGAQVVYVRVDVATGQRTIWLVSQAANGWHRPRQITIRGTVPAVSRTLSFSAADSLDGGDILWHADTVIGPGRALMLSRTGELEWTASDLTGNRGIGVPVVQSGSMRLFRAPKWHPSENAYRQHVYLALDDGNLARIWWRHGAWHYQALPIVGAPCDPEGNERRARPDVPPAFLFDGTTGSDYGPGGSIAFVGDDDTLWSAFPNDADESLIFRRLKSGVRLRSISGASGLPIGWTYEPQRQAFPLLPGEHPGTKCWGAWDAENLGAACADRVENACGGDPCTCNDGRLPCAFSRPATASGRPVTSHRRSAATNADVQLRADAVRPLLVRETHKAGNASLGRTRGCCRECDVGKACSGTPSHGRGKSPGIDLPRTEARVQTIARRPCHATMARQSGAARVCIRPESNAPGVGDIW